MISHFFKLLLSLTTSAGCIYSIQTFGLNYGLVAVLIVALIIFISIFYPAINLLAKILGNGISVISALALALLLLAGTIGGSFHLSPSNEVISIFLLFISLFGLTSFFWSVPLDEST